MSALSQRGVGSATGIGAVDGGGLLNLSQRFERLPVPAAASNDAVFTLGARRS